MKNNILSKFAKYTSMNVMGMIGLSCYILADTFFVSKGMGADGLAALNLAIPVYSFINGTGLMIGMGGGTAYAVALGQGNREKADGKFNTSFMIAAVFSAVFFLCGIFFSPQITSLLGGDTEKSPRIYEMTLTYLRMILLFSPAFILNNLLQCFIRNDGSPQLSMTAMLAGSFSNIVLDYIFIFSLKMGIFGAVLATCAAPFIGIAVLLTRKSSFRLKRSRFDMKEALSVLSPGVPSLVTEVSAGLVMIIFNIIILRINGNTGVAAYGVVANISLVVMSVFTGIAQGMQPVLSTSFGSGRKNDTSAVLRYGIITASASAVLVYITLFALASPVTSIFNSGNHAELQMIAEKGLRIYFTACPFAALNIILAVFFSSTCREKPAQAISLLRGFILIIPSALVLSEAFGLNGVWLALPVTELLTAAISVIILKLPGKDKI
ncbi:MAG: MATE family efflux transporter [Oscillospiraceae bacterium]|nr:MATE family efflux transporter [Oscillospiraceae bacterium]